MAQKKIKKHQDVPLWAKHRSREINIGRHLTSAHMTSCSSGLHL